MSPLSPYLFVDLDHTLVKTDVLQEQGLKLFLKHPFQGLKLFFSHFKNPASLKREVERLMPVDPKTLPYHSDVLHLLQEAKKNGQKVILATAADQKVGQKIAAHLGLCEDIIASTPPHNLKGIKKLEAIQAYTKGQPFDYIGDSPADIPILKSANKAIVVGNLKIDRAIERLERPPLFKTLLKQLRVHQWSKNGLIFLPLLASHQINAFTIGQALFGFVCFCFAASSIYLLNDLADLEDDRNHPLKKKRPLAAGDLGILGGLSLMGVLTLIVIGGAFFLPMQALGTLGLYYGITISYSMGLKKIPILDIYILSALYSIRVLFGNMITGIPPSSWLIMFCLFFFLSLACLKRVSELSQVEQEQQKLSSRRGYIVKDLAVLLPVGIGCALSSILVFSLYITSHQVELLYTYPERLWFIVFLLLFWKLRLWFLGGRSEINQDPIVFVLGDKVTYIIALGIFLTAFMAS